MIVEPPFAAVPESVGDDHGFADFPAVTDINDIITNTVGGTVGYILIKKYRSQKC